jgi:SprT-like family protein
MFRALKRFLKRPDPSQLTLPLDGAPRSGDELLAKLRSLGLRRIERCRLTSNRNVMVSFRGTELRVHEGYLTAPDAVLRAIVIFIEGRSRADRYAARRQIVAHPVRTSTRPPRRQRTRPEDARIAAELTHQHATLNARHFDGALRAIPVRVSRRMKTRLGHYTAATANEPPEIAISWRHVRRHGWTEALHTLLHEMVHQWQDEQGFAIDHGSSFRAKAREVGITPSARRRPCGTHAERLEA